jgi:hypothetical protein
VVQEIAKDYPDVTLEFLFVDNAAMQMILNPKQFDIVIIPYFPDGAKNVLEEYYVGVTRAKNQAHILCINEIPKIMSTFDKNTYELIDNRK